MISQRLSGRVPSLAIVLLGTLLVIFGFTAYPVVTALIPTQVSRSEDFVIDFAYFALGVDTLGLCTLFYGATNFLTSWSTGEAPGRSRSIVGRVAAPCAHSRYPPLVIASASGDGRC